MVLKNVMGRRYLGSNQLRLSFIRGVEKYDSEHWGTFLQIKGHGGKVKKGEKGTKIFYSGLCEISDNLDKKNDTDKEKFITKHYTVFNFDQCEWKEKENISIQPLPSVEEWLKKIDFNLEHKAGSAFYSPSRDVVNVPPSCEFESRYHYYAVMFHELVHWTGAEGRSYRPGKKDYKTDIKARAFEELVAELGSCFLMSEFGIKADTKNNEAYLDNWLSALDSDTSYLSKAAVEASKAVEFLMSM